MTDNTKVLFREHTAPSGVPRLAGGLDVRELAARGAPGEVIIDLATRHTDDHLPETHKDNLSLRLGLSSMAERLRAWRRTTIGRMALVAAAALPVAVAVAGCGGSSVHERPPAVGVEAPGAGGGEIEGDRPTRIIIGKAACYDGFEKLPAAEQKECSETFADFTLEQVGQLAPFDQARWALSYRDELLADGKPGSSPERLTWSAAIKKDTLRTNLANNIITAHTHDVARLSWLMQQPDTSVGNDPRTWAAMFGVGTTIESEPIQDAHVLKETVPTSGLGFDEYLRRVIVKTELFSTPAQDVTTAEESDGSITLSFTATHNRGDTTTAFEVRYFPYLYLESEGDELAFRELTANKEATMLYGRPLLGNRIVKNT